MYQILIYKSYYVPIHTPKTNMFSKTNISPQRACLSFYLLKCNYNEKLICRFWIHVSKQNNHYYISMLQICVGATFEQSKASVYQVTREFWVLPKNRRCNLEFLLSLRKKALKVFNFFNHYMPRKHKFLAVFSNRLNAESLTAFSKTQKPSELTKPYCYPKPVSLTSVLIMTLVSG